MKPCAVIINGHSPGDIRKRCRTAFREVSVLRPDQPVPAGVKYVFYLGRAARLPDFPVLARQMQQTHATKVAFPGGFLSRFCAYHPQIACPTKHIRDVEPRDIKPADDMAVILVHYGTNPARFAAVRQCVANLQRQTLRPRIVFVDLVFDGETPQFEDLPGVEYHRIDGADRNRVLFQKEALFNIGAALTDTSYLIFADADVYCEDATWFAQLRAHLDVAPNAIVQGCQHFADSREARLSGASYAYAHEMQRFDIAKCPGLVWAMHRGYWEQIEGWNPWGISGSGDALFIYEHIAGCRYSDGYFRYAWWRAVLRKGQPPGRVSYVPVSLTHVNHGSWSDRAYHWSRAVIDRFGLVEEFVELGDRALLAWRDPDCPLRRVLARKPELIDAENTMRVVTEECRK